MKASKWLCRTCTTSAGPKTLQGQGGGRVGNAGWRRGNGGRARKGGEGGKADVGGIGIEEDSLEGEAKRKGRGKRTK